MMDNYTAVMIAEGQQEPETDDEFYEAWQHLVDTGLAWELQGWFGRQAAAMIEDGLLEGDLPY